MKNLLFLLASLVVAPLFAQPLPYVALDTTVLENYPTQNGTVLRVLNDNSFIYTTLTKPVNAPTKCVFAKIGENGIVEWIREESIFYPVQVIEGPSNNLTFIGLEVSNFDAGGMSSIFTQRVVKIINPQGQLVNTSILPCENIEKCGILATAVTQLPYEQKVIPFSDGSYLHAHNTYDSTQTGLIAPFTYTLSKYSASGQKLWSKFMPHYYEGSGGLLHLSTGETMMVGIHHSYLPKYDNDNASFVVNASGTVLSSSLVPRTDDQVNPFHQLSPGFFADQTGGAWIFYAQNMTSLSSGNFPVMRVNAACDTLVSALVGFHDSASYQYMPVRAALSGCSTPDNGAIFLISAASSPSDGQTYLLKIAADGSYDWHSQMSGYTSNTGTYLYLTTDGDLMQVDKNTVRLTRWHIPVGTGVAEAVAQPGLSVAPNPVKDVLTATFSAPAAGAITLTISDLSGRQFLSQPMQAVAGANTGQLSVAELAPGMYVLSAAGATGVAAQTVFVKE